MYICLPEFYVLIPYVIYWNFKLSQEVACRWQQVFGKMSNGNLEVWWSRSYYVTLCPHQFRSVTQSCPALCDPMNYSTPGLPVHHQLPSPPKPMSIESVMPSNHLILCRPLLLPPSIFPSIRVFSNEKNFLASGGQSIGASASTSVLPMNTQDWSPLGDTLSR